MVSSKRMGTVDSETIKIKSLGRITEVSQIACRSQDRSGMKINKSYLGCCKAQLTSFVESDIAHKEELH